MKRRKDWRPLRAIASNSNEAKMGGRHREVKADFVKHRAAAVLIRYTENCS
jgi:hypothetical protein